MAIDIMTPIPIQYEINLALRNRIFPNFNLSIYLDPPKRLLAYVYIN